MGERGFAILVSDGAGEPSAAVAPDVATCADCLAELRDPADRRHRYPFINCTACGPRYTIVTGVPYDRARTTMAGFAMCDLCRAEYEDPSDRRFHAEPIACPACGPSARLVDPGGGAVPGDPVAAAAAALLDGRIVAVKGIGGFHLACLAGDEEAVARLRGRKRREEKPFAVMVPDVAAARLLVRLSPGEEELLAGRERPIVLARRRAGGGGRAVGGPALGRPRGDAPLLPAPPPAPGRRRRPAGDDQRQPLRRAHRAPRRRRPGAPGADRRPAAAARPPHPHARRRLGGARGPRAAAPPDAPLARLGAGEPAPSRSRPSGRCWPAAPSSRARPAWPRGAAPGWATTSATSRTGRRCAPSASRSATWSASSRSTPEVVAHDLHPGYLSTAYALEREGVETLAVQHHHAHLAACLAEWGEQRPRRGGDPRRHRLRHRRHDLGRRDPGGRPAGRAPRRATCGRCACPAATAAIREPWRMACAWLAEASGEREPAIPAGIAGRVAPATWSAVARLARLRALAAHHQRRAACSTPSRPSAACARG